MKQYTLSKKEQILKSHEFKNIYHCRRVKKNEFFWAYYKPNGLGYSRLGVSVSNRLCLNIAQRNRIKRLIRQFFRLNKPFFCKGTDVVFVLKKRPEILKFDFFEKTIKTLIRKP